MSVVRPFRARVVRQDHAASHVARMLDALPAAERPAAIAGRNGPSRQFEAEAYDDAAAAFYVYRLRRGEDEHVGIVGEVLTEAFTDGRVRGHEAVQPERVAGLVEHFTLAAVRSELVALLHPPSEAVAGAVARVVDTAPVLRFTGPDSWEQTVWRVPDAVAEVLSAELGGTVHYIADGHHRVAASLSVWQRDGRPAEAGVMCVMYPLDGLSLLAFHRRVAGPVAAEELVSRLSVDFAVREVAGHDAATGCFALYADRRWYDVAWTGDRAPGAAGLDLAILNEQVLEPLLGTGPEASARLEITSGLTSWAELTEACDRDGGVLFALRAPSLEELTEVADRGEVMPPKTTYFDPKPYAGIFLR